MPANHPWKTWKDAEHAKALLPKRLHTRIIRRGHRAQWVVMDSIGTIYAEGFARNTRTAQKDATEAKRGVKVSLTVERENPVPSAELPSSPPEPTSIPEITP